MSPSSQKIFAALVDKPKSTKKWMFIPLSLVLHGIVIAGLIVFPLLSADADLPPVKITQIFLTAPAPPSIPPPPAAPKGGGRRGRERAEEKAETPKPIDPGRLVQPVAIPEDVEEEDIGMLGGIGFEGGIPGGIEGGVEGGVPGGVPGSVLIGKGEQDFKELRITTVQKPRLIKRIDPTYPAIALKAHIQGQVIVEATTDIYGKVVKTRVIGGNPLLTKAAVDAVRQWVYEPYMISGMPRPVVFTVTVTFTLQR
jgi:protein TonB